MRRVKGANPYFPLWADEFDARTRELTVGELGLYFRLLLYQWSRGCVPSDPKRLQQITGCSGLKFGHRWKKVSELFASRCDGTLQDPAMEDTRVTVQSKIDKQTKGGRWGAIKRWTRERLRARVLEGGFEPEASEAILEHIDRASIPEEFDALESKLNELLGPESAD